MTGSSGYIMVPNAEGLKYQEWDFGLSAFSGTPVQDSHWKYNLGLGWSEWLELTFCGRSEREGLFNNAKWYSKMQDEDNPMYVAFGWENMPSMGSFQEYPSIYMVMTKKFLGGHSFSIGSAGRYIEKDKEIKASIMAGTEFYTSEQVSWLIDCLAYEDNKYNANFGLRIYTTPKMYFDFFAINLVRNANKIINEDDEEVEAHPFYGMLSMTIKGFL
jgi:hypothetical protein